MRMNLTSPKRGGETGPEMITCFLVSSRLSMRSLKSSLSTFDCWLFMSFIPPSTAIVQSVLCRWISSRVMGVMSLTWVPGKETVWPLHTATCHIIDAPTTGNTGGRPPANVVRTDGAGARGAAMWWVCRAIRCGAVDRNLRPGTCSEPCVL